MRRSLLFVSFISIHALAVAQSFQPVDLDAAGSMFGPVAMRVSDGADPVGYGQPTLFAPIRAVVFRTSGPVFLPQFANDVNVSASAMNRAGIVVGNANVVVASTSTAHPRAWWNGNVFDLNSFVTTPSPLILVQANAIDDRNRVVGTAAFTVSGPRRAFVLDAGVVTDLHALAPAGSLESAANQVSVAGPIVGWVQKGPMAVHACLWDAAGFHDLNDPAQGNTGFSDAQDADRSGRACGSAQFGGVSRAALFDHGSVVDLGSLFSRSAAHGMNDLGVVVGDSDFDSTHEFRAVRWRAGTLVDLNTLIPSGSGWVLTVAQDVDNAGRIAAYGRLNGVDRPCLLVPNCAGGYAIGAAGCAAPAGTPTLAGVSCPEPGTRIALVHEHGPPSATGIIAFGTGSTPVAVNPFCSLGIGPLVPAFAPLSLDADGAAFVVASVPLGTSGASASVQSAFLAPGAPGGVATTNALSIAIP